MTSWYNLPIVGGFGTYPDPVGNYPKPDINIIAPAGTAFTAPASGTITSIDTSSFYGKSVTVKFDNPPNDTAQYYAFNYMSSILPGLQVGQHVNIGETLAYGGDSQNNSGGTAAFALSAGPAYGKGEGWTQNVVGTWINPKLDPSTIVSNLKAGVVQQGLPNIQIPSFPSLFQFLGLPSQADLVSFMQQMMLVFSGVMLLLIGFMILFFSSDTGKKTINVGERAAEAGAMA